MYLDASWIHSRLAIAAQRCTRMYILCIVLFDGRRGGGAQCVIIICARVYTTQDYTACLCMTLTRGVRLTDYHRRVEYTAETYRVLPRPVTYIFMYCYCNIVFTLDAARTIVSRSAGLFAFRETRRARPKHDTVYYDNHDSYNTIKCSNKIISMLLQRWSFATAYKSTLIFNTYVYIFIIQW